MTPAPDVAIAPREDLLPRLFAARAQLHRYCSRMTGSPLDGEDVVQETLAQASASLASLEDAERLDQWLFRIAYHKCVDFLRRDMKWRENSVEFVDEHEAYAYDESPDAEAPVDAGLATLVYKLPPKERAAVLLKDVLEYDLAAVAEIIDSTVGGVKAALHRGRGKLRALRSARTESFDAPLFEPDADSRLRTLFKSYVECFNNRDWEALRHLIQTDARFELVGVLSSTMDDAGRNYFSNYVHLPYAWRLALGRVAGEWVIVHERRDAGAWIPYTAVRLWWAENLVVRIRDYVHVSYLMLDVQSAHVTSPEYPRTVGR